MLWVYFTMTTSPLPPSLALYYKNLVECLKVKLMKVCPSPAPSPKNVTSGVSHLQANPHLVSSNLSHLPHLCSDQCMAPVALLQLSRSWLWLLYYPVSPDLGAAVVLQPQFSDGSKKKCWFSVCSAFFL